MAEERLVVWYEGRRVGTLWRQRPVGTHPIPDFGFTFDPGWIEDGFRPSLGFFVQEEPLPASAAEVKAFFTNLLPEESARERMALNARLSRADIFGLLREYGGDCAGAFSILPEGIAPATEYRYTPLAQAELRQLIEMRGVVPLTGNDGTRPRLSLAGAQAKSPVYIDAEGKIALPQGAAPSSHILKFASADYPGLLANEFFMLRLAAAAELRVVSAELRSVGCEHPYLIVERYDRVIIDGDLRRLHQQDLCQAQDLMDWAKYENRDDPEISWVSFASCLKTVRDASETPLSDALRLLDWQVFNLVTGNADGHAKNLALVQSAYGKDTWVLAPFYDLVCARIYPAVNHQLALGFGGSFDPLQITQAHVERFASDARMQRRFMTQRVLEFIDRVEKAIPNAKATTLHALAAIDCTTADDILDAIHTEIQTLCAHLRSALL